MKMHIAFVVQFVNFKSIFQFVKYRTNPNTEEVKGAFFICCDIEIMLGRFLSLQFIFAHQHITFDMSTSLFLFLGLLENISNLLCKYKLERVSAACTHPLQ